jgi:AcrR family transcriptional regulator
MNEADPRVKRTRKLLRDAFVALLAERRFHRISVQDIAERATVNRATFYAHFVDKYELLDDVFGAWFRETVTSRMSPVAPFTAHELRLLIVTVLESLARFHGHCQGQAPGRELSPLMEARVQRELNTYVLAWLERTPPADGPPPALREPMASVLSWAIFGAGIEWSRGGNAVPVDERARQLVAVLTGGAGSGVGAGSLEDAPETRAVSVALERQ